VPEIPDFNGPNGKYSVCFECGTKHGVMPPAGGRGMGMWLGVCDICGKQKALANAYHDFGLTDTEVAFLFQVHDRGEKNE
jgi:hypothetical protein